MAIRKRSKEEPAHFTFEVKGLDEDLRVLRFNGTEGVSQLFRYELTVAVEGADLDFSKVVNQPATLLLHTDEGPRRVAGIVSRLELGPPAGRFTLYHVTLVPDVWRLTLRTDCRIFQDKGVKDIVTVVLGDAKVPGDAYRFNLSGDHPARTYCVQYRESDWDFVTRLLEEEGIFHFFEHGEAGAVLVMGDAPAAHAAIEGDPKLSFVPKAGLTATGEHVTDFSYAEEVRPGKVVLTDYDFVKPSLNLLAESGSDAFPEVQVYDYPGDYTDPGAGKKVASARLEALNAVRRVASGESTSPRLVPGFQFELADYTREDLNAKYTLTVLSQSGEQPQVLEEVAGSGGSQYSNRFQAVPADVPFRPVPRTTRPVVEGPQTAVVVGPKGEEIYTDEFGRVKVHFHWDRKGTTDEHGSCWIRVSQVWAGAGWGAIQIPRVGQEVVVDFLEGDPDRPIITGRVYHGSNRPPYPLPDRKTVSAVKSNSSKGGDGSNELRFEDKKGSEEVYLHGQRNWVIEIENEKSEKVGASASIDIGKNRTEKVGADRALSVGGNKTESVSKDKSVSVSGKRSEDVGKDASLAVAGNLGQDVAKDATLSVGKNLTQSVAADMSLSVDGALNESVGKAHKEAVKEGYGLEAKEVFIEGKDSIELKCGSASIILKKNGDIQIKGNKIQVKGSGDVVIKGSKIGGN